MSNAHSNCFSCKAKIVWVNMKSGKRMPCDAEEVVVTHPPEAATEANAEAETEANAEAETEAETEAEAETDNFNSFERGFDEAFEQRRNSR